MATLDKITVSSDGTVFVRWIKEDGGYHRTTIPSSVDPDFQLDAVEAHLKELEGKVSERIKMEDRLLIRDKYNSIPKVDKDGI